MYKAYFYRESCMNILILQNICVHQNAGESLVKTFFQQNEQFHAERNLKLF